MVALGHTSELRTNLDERIAIRAQSKSRSNRITENPPRVIPKKRLDYRDGNGQFIQSISYPL